MRKIGEIADWEQGALLGAYLLSQGISNQIDPDDDGSWIIWIHVDEKLDAAREILSQFKDSPDDSKYAAGAESGRKRLADEAAKDERFRKNYYDRKRLFTGMRIGIVTAFLIGMSFLITILTGFGKDGQDKKERELTSAVSITAFQVDYSLRYFTPALLHEVRAGEVWRLVTPIFLHLGFIHFLFNMMWIADLGTILERRHGAIVLLLFVLVIGGVSNLLQFVVSGPRFGGMSGVVYGLLGYLWIRAKTDPFYDIHLRKNTVIMMGIWFFLCMMPGSNVANMAHGGGLAVGALAGYVSGLLAKRNRFEKAK